MRIMSLGSLVPYRIRRLAIRFLPPRLLTTVRDSFDWYDVLLRRFIFSLPFVFCRRYQYPLFLSIFLTTRCNFKCFICRRENFKSEDLKFENLRKLEKPIKYARTIDLTGWGEPLLYPRFQDVLDYIYSLNKRSDLIFMTTNGTRLSKDIARLLDGHLKSLIISLNAGAEETYRRETHYGNLQQTISSIQDFLSGLKEKDRHKIELHFVAHTRNFHEIPDFVMLAHELGISKVRIGQYIIGIAEHAQYSLLHVKEKYNAVIEQAQKVGDKIGVKVYAPPFFTKIERNYQNCLSPFNECFILPNGNVSACCFWGGTIPGNVYETNFEAVWFGQAYRQLRQKRDTCQPCRQCTIFAPFDSCSAHFDANFKKTKEFEQIKQQFDMNSERNERDRVLQPEQDR